MFYTAPDTSTLRHKTNSTSNSSMWGKGVSILYMSCQLQLCYSSSESIGQGILSGTGSVARLIWSNKRCSRVYSLLVACYRVYIRLHMVHMYCWQGRIPRDTLFGNCYWLKISCLRMMCSFLLWLNIICMFGRILLPLRWCWRILRVWLWGMMSLKGRTRNRWTYRISGRLSGRSSFCSGVKGG